MSTPPLEREPEVLGLSLHVVAPTYQFSAFSAFEGLDAPYLAPIQLTYTLEEEAGKVYFTVLNSSNLSDTYVYGYAPTVTKIYVQDKSGVLGAIGFFDPAGSAGTAEGLGVAYSDAIAGGNLPGGETIGFEESFYFRPDSPVVNHGIDPGESARFEIGAITLVEVMAALSAGDLRFGLHVQEVGNFSASFVSDPPVIPEAGTSVLALLGSGLLLLRRRR